MSYRRVFFTVLAGGSVLLLGISCASRSAVRTEPSLRSFYDEARQIMTDDEAKVFKSLPDEPSRAEFIREFWAVRDPDPGTPENEAQTEYQKRARYAALWFGTQNPYKGRDPGGPLSNLAGLNEERGRVYVLLGKPDVIIFYDGSTEMSSYDGSRSRLRTDQWVLEEWIYDRLHTYVVFRRSGTGGEWLLDSFHPNFIDLLEWSKLNWLQDDVQPDVRTWFRFSADYGPLGIQISVPVERVSTDDRFQVELGIEVLVLRDGLKVDEIRDTKTFKETQENLFEGKSLRFGIPYTPAQKGAYVFDIIIRDLKAPRPSKYRVLLKQTL